MSISTEAYRWCAAETLYWFLRYAKQKVLAEPAPITLPVLLNWLLRILSVAKALLANVLFVIFTLVCLFLDLTELTLPALKCHKLRELILPIKL